MAFKGQYLTPISTLDQLRHILPFRTRERVLGRPGRVAGAMSQADRRPLVDMILLFNSLIKRSMIEVALDGL